MKGILFFGFITASILTTGCHNHYYYKGCAPMPINPISPKDAYYQEYYNSHPVTPQEFNYYHSN